MSNLPAMVGKKELVRVANMKPPKFLNADDIRLIINTAQKARYKLLFNFLWQTGARISEALALSYEDIDFEHHQVRLIILKTRRKGNKKEDLDGRWIPINTELQTALSTYITLNRLNPYEELFKMTPEAAHMELKHVLKKAGLPNWIHLHTFRHSFAINCLRQGVLINTLKQLLGHSRIENTLIYLTVFQPDVQRQMANVQF